MLSEQIYKLNHKVQLLSLGNLRYKITRFLLEQEDSFSSKVSLAMNREEFADYLGVTRPSLSRELMSMQDNGLILVERRSFRLLNRPALEKILKGK